MKKFTFIIAVWAIVFFTAGGLAAEKRITIVHTNDMHSHLQGFSPEIDYQPFIVNADETRGGWSRVAAVIQKTKREKSNPVLVVDAGDYTMGSFFHMLNREEAFELRLLKAMGYDVVSLGNHEFDLKPAGLTATLRTAQARGGTPQIVFANAVFDRQKPELADLENAFGQAGVKSYTILERDGLKIGVFGILGKDAIEVSPFAKPLKFSDPIQAARDMVKILREQQKADLVVCLSHSGLRDNPKKSEDEILASEVKGIDIIVSGHTHTLLGKPLLVNGTLIVQAGSYGKHVGVLDIAWESGRVALKNYTLIPVDSSVAGDPKIQRMIDSFKQQLNARLLGPNNWSYDRIVAETAWDLKLAAEESPLGNLLADSIRWSVNRVSFDPGDPSSRVIVAVESNGVIRDDLLRGKTGQVGFGDLFRTIPLGIGVDDTMSYPLVSFYLYGYELKRALEILTTVRPLKSNNDYFLQLSGLRFTYNPRRVPFDRVTAVEIGSEEEGYQPLDYSASNTRLYRVAANIYNATFLKVVGRFTYSLLEITPKDQNGRPLEKLSGALVDADPSLPGIQELKEWEGVLRYVQSFPDTNGNGIPDFPAKYSGKLGRIVEAPSCNPVHLFSRPATPTIIVLAGAGVVLWLIVVTVAVIQSRRKVRRGK
ncbi:MAG TPA: bifunctional UDP-sugar hydrolase/5'-nucleotidase [Smithellaceae bacterium]|nr:bifunctional UDP-sugar hydrolase/5'-nucleotidase [Smithellaceae bacterium]HRV45271.1 bifunctional UDP-sugar hydrolase/5'-nucleotidase [Smithellaceae bacterium]